MKLAYNAFDANGRSVSDVIDAANPAEAAESLRRQGLFVTRITGHAGRSVQTAARVRGGGRKIKNIALFTRQLHVLVASGTPVIQALSALERQMRDVAWREVIARLRTSIEEGASLSEAMEACPQYFDAVYRSLITAGEAGGSMEEMLDRLADLARKRLHIRQSLIGALIYPALLVVVAATVLILLLTFVVPRFGELFKTLAVPLPSTTRLLMGISGGLRSYWWAVLAGLAGAAVGLRLYLRSETGRRTLNSIVLRVPQAGRIVRSMITARIIRLLGMLLDGNVPVLEALKLTRQSVSNHQYVALLTRAKDSVGRGEPISSAFVDASLISPSVYEAMRNGEVNGKVSELLLNMSDFMDEENEVIVRSLTSIVEPVILVMLGALVAFVAMSMFTPLFDLTAMTQGGGKWNGPCAGPAGPSAWTWAGGMSRRFNSPDAGTRGKLRRSAPCHAARPAER